MFNWDPFYAVFVIVTRLVYEYGFSIFLQFVSRFDECEGSRIPEMYLIWMADIVICLLMF